MIAFVDPWRAAAVLAAKAMPPILGPHPNGNGNGAGKAWNVGIDSAEAELALTVRLGLVHESLVEEPRLLPERRSQASAAAALASNPSR
jgi:hypothetical protein